MAFFRAALLLFAICGTSAMRKGKQTSKCGRRKGSPDPMSLDVNMSIVNGRPSAECSWPWQISTRMRPDQHWCGGTLISPEWVLTAAHCRTGLKLLVAGSTDKAARNRGTWQERVPVKEILHPSYNKPIREANDLMLVKVDKPFELTDCVNTACLPTGRVRSGKSCWITGWGTLRSNARGPTQLQEAAVDIKECAGSKYDPKTITEEMMCANGETIDGKTTDACQGDSGGPLVCESSAGVWEVQGATSWGMGCALTDYPGIWSSVTDNLDWIYKTMEEN